MYKQRDIVLIPFPYSDLSGAKQRPALIISNKNLSKSQDRMCCLITSTNTKDGTLISSNFLEQGTLPLKSWVKPYRIFTVHENIIKKKICSVTHSFHDRIISHINKYISSEKTL